MNDDLYIQIAYDLIHEKIDDLIAQIIDEIKNLGEECALPDDSPCGESPWLSYAQVCQQGVSLYQGLYEETIGGIILKIFNGLTDTDKRLVWLNMHDDLKLEDQELYSEGKNHQDAIVDYLMARVRNEAEGIDLPLS